jgi:hypothetical protein
MRGERIYSGHRLVREWRNAVVRSLLFVLMPFGKKSDGQGRLIDFDAVYEQVIKPAAIAAELDPIRADE